MWTKPAPRKGSKYYMKVYYHNKGIEMLDLPRILNIKIVRDTVPPMVSYTYTKSICGCIFNQRKVVEELKFDKGTAEMYCECSYCYEPAGHVVTGDLNFISLVFWVSFFSCYCFLASVLYTCFSMYIRLRCYADLRTH